MTYPTLSSATPNCRVAVDEINRQHQIRRAYFFSQRRFRKCFNVEFPIGLCAGLVQVWWAELRKGNDAIYSLQHATPSLLRDVLLSQMRSVYLRDFPASENELTGAELRLLTFKYGQCRLSELQSLQGLLGATGLLELDLVLQHEQPILKQWTFEYFDEDLLNILTRGVGLHLFLTRYTDRRRAGTQKGHRAALVSNQDGFCRFYDPSWGEVSFERSSHFKEWFSDYLKVRKWNELARPTATDSPLIRIFNFGGVFSPEAAQKIAMIRDSIWDAGSTAGIRAT